MTAVSISPRDSKRVLVAGDMLGIGLSTDGGKTWQPTFGLPSYECADFTWKPGPVKKGEPGEVWAGSMSGPLLSIDGGRNWTVKRKGFPEFSSNSYSCPIERVVFDGSNPTRLLAFGGSSRRWSSPGQPAWGAVWESRDHGENWKRLSTVGNGVNVVAANYAAPQKWYALGDNAGFFVSEDDGATWQPRNTGLRHTNVSRLQVHPKNPNWAWVSLGNHRSKSEGNFEPGGIFETKDAGRSWKEISNGLDQHATQDANQTARFEGLAVSPKDPRVMVTGDTAWNTGVIYWTTDGGQNWRPVATKGNIGQSGSRENVPVIKTALFAGLGITNFTFDPNDSSRAIGFNTELLVETTDSGEKWTDLMARTAPDGGITGTGYTGWCSQNISFDPYQKGRSILQALDAGRSWLSIDGLKTWRYGSGYASPWFGGTSTAWTKTGRVYAGYGQFGAFQGIGRSDDGGKSWTILAGADHNLPELSYGGSTPVDGIYSDPDAPDRVWASLGGTLIGSTDGGAKWKTVLGRPGLRWIAGDPSKPRRFYIVGDRGVYRTEDGVKFENIGGPKPATRAVVDGEGRVYVTSHRTDSAGLWRFSAGKWERLLDEYTIHSVAVDPKHPNRIAVTTAMDPYRDTDPSPGVYLSSDSGKTWYLANDGLPMRRAQAIAFDPFDSNSLLVGLYGRGFYRTNWPVLTNLRGTRIYESTTLDQKLAAKDEFDGGAAVKLKNGDFDATIDGWSVLWTGRGKLSIARDSEVAKVGTASLRISSETNSMGQAGQTIEAPGGARFKVRGFLRTAGTAKVNVAIQPVNAGWTPIGFLQAAYAQNATDWTLFERVIEIPPGAARANLVILMEGQGIAWVDDIQILPAP